MIAPRSSSARVLRELLGYGGASAIALAVDVSLLELLVREFGWHYVPASALAFVSGGLVAYSLSVRFVFEQHRLHSRSVELGLFLGLGAVGLAVNALVLSLAVGVAGLGLLTAKACATGCTFATNFALRRNLLFVTHAAATR
jgi:putative flippase GtrA